MSYESCWRCEAPSGTLITDETNETQSGTNRDEAASSGHGVGDGVTSLIPQHLARDDARRETAKYAKGASALAPLITERQSGFFAGVGGCQGFKDDTNAAPPRAVVSQPSKAVSSTIGNASRPNAGSGRT